MGVEVNVLLLMMDDECGTVASDNELPDLRTTTI
jgi:hypothetical protein